MAVKNVNLGQKKGMAKPLIVCEHEKEETKYTPSHFNAGEAELKKVADTLAKSVINNKRS
jgi:hypothetical protein